MTGSAHLDDHKINPAENKAPLPEEDPYDQLEPAAKAAAIRRFHKQRLFLLLMGALAWLLAALSWRLGPSAHAMGLARLTWAPSFLTFFVLWSRMPRNMRNFVIRAVIFPKLKALFLVRDLMLPCLFFGLSLWAVGQAFNLLPWGRIG
ncbi:MAG: hypothetical protein ABF760_04145 [Zymomonas mobilis]|uniref:Uncharacterized protein n=1 Tax=Zymomonas mobilis TaxID=542 RepID=A0A542W372_ZYMMB|nr:hypothetical protein [Zymomonas mobilis]TQL18024.1 hypothetical protein FBY58_1638 [Zymomonas mobilis]